MNTSNYNKKIDVFVNTISKSSGGAPVKNKTLLFSTFANQYIRGGNTVYNETSGRNQSVVEWTIRYNSLLDDDCEIHYENETYKIQDIEEIGRKQEQKITTIRFKNITN